MFTFRGMRCWGGRISNLGRLAAVSSLRRLYPIHLALAQQAPSSSRFLSTASKKRHNEPRKKPSKVQGPSGTAGRIVLQERGARHSKKRKRPKLCVGCGTEVVAGGASTGMVAGADAVVDQGRSKRMAKMARYVDTMEEAGGGFLCRRCKALKQDDVWKAYDALRDVEPKVFLEQLKYIVSRRRFGLCILVVDASDSEHSAIKNLREAVKSTPVILCLNKIDLLPRMNYRDQRALSKKIESATTRFTATYATSAETGEGLVDLAHHILENLGGRDVFVVGSANVGKSTLVKKLSGIIAESVYMKGKSRGALRRKEMAANLNVTSSNLPGTTLQAVRIPCFPSKNHALWDTPGVINARALQYRIFPAHLMEPLTHPGEIQIPTRENKLGGLRLFAGYSILIEAAWMTDDDNASNDDDNEEPCVLARLDLLDNSTSQVIAEAYIHPALKVRLVPTAKAPSTATIPPRHIEHVKRRIIRATKQSETGLNDHYSLPLKAFTDKSRPNGEFHTSDNEYNGKFYQMDIVFPSLGWISMHNDHGFSVIPHCVEGSVFSKRPSLYPVNLSSWLERHGNWEEPTSYEVTEADKKALRLAADRGRRNSGRKQRGSSGEGYDDYQEYGEWH